MKKIKQYLAFAIALLPAVACGQNLTEVWGQISINNLTINALEKQMEAEQIRNHVGLAPENPEVEFAYLWGSPNSIGNRIDVSVTQSFEFPTTYVYRSRIADLKDEQVGLSLRSQMMEAYLEVGTLYYNIVYQNTRIRDMERCLQFLSDVSAAYKQKLDAGEINIFDYNKVKLSELNMRQEKAHAETERDAMLLKIKQLNGGKSIDITLAEFPEITLPDSITDWASRSPRLQWYDKQQEIAQQQLKLDRSLWAPQFFVGYMREQVPSETFQGLKVGLSVPLWKNANTLRQNQLQNSAINMIAADEQFKLQAHLEGCYATAKSMLRQIEEYRALLASVDELELLNQALDSGQLSLVEYLYELSAYHESHERFAEMQHDAALEFLELEAYRK